MILSTSYPNSKSTKTNCFKKPFNYPDFFSIWCRKARWSFSPADGLSITFCNRPLSMDIASPLFACFWTAAERKQSWTSRLPSREQGWSIFCWLISGPPWRKSAHMWRHTLSLCKILVSLKDSAHSAYAACGIAAPWIPGCHTLSWISPKRLGSCITNDNI